MTARARSVVAALLKWRAEVAVAIALLGGWLALTIGLASLLGHRVWPFAIALLLLSLGGWKLCWTLATCGLYKLTREPKVPNG